MLAAPVPGVKLFEIAIGRRRFAVAREPDGRDQFYQTYYVDGRVVPVQHYLKMIAMATGRDAGPPPHDGEPAAASGGSRPAIGRTTSARHVRPSALQGEYLLSTSSRE